MPKVHTDAKMIYRKDLLRNYILSSSPLFLITFFAANFLSWPFVLYGLGRKFLSRNDNNVFVQVFKLAKKEKSIPFKSGKKNFFDFIFTFECHCHHWFLLAEDRTYFFDGENWEPLLWRSSSSSSGSSSGLSSGSSLKTRLDRCC